MRACVLGGLTGAVGGLIALAAAGAAVCFVRGVGTGYEGERPPFTAAAASLGALSFILVGGIPAGLLGLAVGSAVADVRRSRELGGDRPVPRPWSRGLAACGMIEALLGLGPFLLCGALLVTDSYRFANAGEWQVLLGVAGWFVTGTWLVVAGGRLLCDRHQPVRSALGWRAWFLVCLASLSLWGAIHAARSPRDPTGALHAGMSLILVGSPILIAVALLGTMWWLHRRGR